MKSECDGFRPEKTWFFNFFYCIVSFCQINAFEPVAIRSRAPFRRTGHFTCARSQTHVEQWDKKKKHAPNTSRKRV